MQPLLVAGAFSAFAPDPQAVVGVAPITVSGDSAAHIDEQLSAAVDSALAEAAFSHRVLTTDWVAESCAEAQCRAQGMRDGGLDYLLQASVEVVERDYETTLEVYDTNGSLVGELESTCEICTPDEAAGQLGREAAELVGSIEPVVEEGPEPEPAPVQVPEPEGLSGERKARYVGYGLIGAGAAGLISGITMIALEEKNYGPKCGDDNTDAAGACEYRHQTVEGGTVLTVLGGLAAGAGVTLVVLTSKAGQSKLAVGPFGQGLKLRGSF